MKMSFNINNKILLMVIPIFSLVIAVYFLFEIITTHKQFQQDFDNSIERSILILEPTLANNIYNLEQNNTTSALKGLFNNENIQHAIVFGDNSQMFAGLKKNGKNEFENSTEKEKQTDYVGNLNLKDMHKISIQDLNNGTRRYISSIFSIEKNGTSYQGVIIIDASTAMITSRTTFMMLRLILGLVASILIASVFTYFSVKRMISNPLAQLTGEIGVQANGIFDSSKNLNATFEKVTNAAKSQSESVVKTVEDMKEISVIVERTKQNATDCNSIVHLLNKKTIEGNNLMQNMTNSVVSIKKSNQNLEKISTIIKNISLKTRVIHEIVSKTELLSLNASIEAARAGDLGKGFSVVAEEVGNLAKVSGSAAKDIEALIIESGSVAESLIQEMNGSVNAVQKNTSDVSESFKEIAQGVETILENTKSIQMATEEQNMAIQKINNSVNEMSDVNKATNQEAQNSLKLVEELDVKSGNLKEIMTSINAIIHGANSHKAQAQNDNEDSFEV